MPFLTESPTLVPEPISKVSNRSGGTANMMDPPTLRRVVSYILRLIDFARRIHEKDRGYGLHVQLGGLPLVDPHRKGDG